MGVMPQNVDDMGSGIAGKIKHIKLYLLKLFYIAKKKRLRKKDLKPGEVEDLDKKDKPPKKKKKKELIPGGTPKGKKKSKKEKSKDDPGTALLDYFIIPNARVNPL